MKNRLWLLMFCYSLTIGAGIAKGVEIQTAPLEQNSPSPSGGDKQSDTIGPRDPEKDKPHGMGVNLFLSKNVAVTSSVALLPPEPNGQTGNSGELDLSASKVGGTVGLKMLFD